MALLVLPVVLAVLVAVAVAVDAQHHHKMAVPAAQVAS
jgi:hypothetical protein